MTTFQTSNKFLGNGEYSLSFAEMGTNMSIK